MCGRVFVTGATGFIGSALLRELAEHGYELHALARPSSDKGGLQGLRVEWHTGDLGDASSLQAFLADARGHALVHNAAVISYRRGDRELQRRVNVEGTRALLVAGRAAGIGRVCHVSSIVTVGHARAGATLDETSAFNSGSLGVDYVDTKRAAEELALEFARDIDLRVVNPAAVFGASTRASNTARFLAAIAQGTLGPCAPPGRLGVVGVRDVACGVRLALEQGSSGRRYILSESDHSCFDLFRQAAGILGVRPVRWRCPAAAWSAVVAAAGLIDRLRPMQLATPQALALMGLSYRCSSARARTELGWSPAPFDEVLTETVAALRARVD